MSNTRGSKYLSLLLRHAPEKANLTLDEEGWCEITQLLQNTNFTIEEIEKIVSDDEKQRYSMKYRETAHCGSGLDIVREPTHIRANQGHSISKVSIKFKQAVPPTHLYHGTNSRAWEIIKKQGLRPMDRHHVHLSDNINTANEVAKRRNGKVVILHIDAKSMLNNEYKFYISENGVWLVDSVPPKYIAEAVVNQ